MTFGQKEIHSCKVGPRLLPADCRPNARVLSQELFEQLLSSYITQQAYRHFLVSRSRISEEPQDTSNISTGRTKRRILPQLRPHSEHHEDLSDFLYHRLSA